MSAARWVAALALLVCVAATAAGEIAIPASPTRWATDSTGFLQRDTVEALDARLHAYEDTTRHQVLLYVTPTTGSTPTEEWTVRAFAKWKVGRKGLDDGLVLFFFPTDHKVRIEVGYGLEQKVPDATAARIIRDITPKLKAGQTDAAAMSGIDEILAAVGGTGAGGAGTARSTNNDASGKTSDGPTNNDGPPTGGVAPVPAPAPSYDGSGQRDYGQIVGVALGILISLGVIVLIGWLISKLPDPPKGTYISSSDGWSLFGDILGGVLGGVSAVGGFSGGGGMSGGGGATGSW